MSAAPPHEDDIAALKRAAAEAAVQLVEDGMVVGLGTGSTAAFAVQALAERRRQGLRFLGIATSERTASQAAAANIPLTSFSEHRQIDLTIDGADEVERATLNLIKGLGGALLREKIVAAASRRVAIIVDETKLVDQLGARTPVPVEVSTFGLEVTQATLEALGARARRRLSPTGEPFRTDGGNNILDCAFGAIGYPAQLEAQIGRVVGVVESGLFINRADCVFVAAAGGVQRLENPRAFGADPPILLVMGVSGAGKTSVGTALAERLGWAFEEGDLLHPQANIAKMRSGTPLTDADRAPWLAAVAAWIDERRRLGEPGIITCSALKRAYRRVVIGDRPQVRLVYLRGARDLIADRLATRSDHFMPPSLLESQLDTLEEPGPEEHALVVDIGPPVSQITETVIAQLVSAQRISRESASARS